MSTDLEDLEGLIGEANDPNILFVTCLIEQFYTSKEETISMSDLAEKIFELKASYPSVLQKNINVYGSEISKTAQINRTTLIDYPLLQEAAETILRRYMTFFGQEIFESMTNKLLSNIGSRIDKDTLTKMIGYQKDAVDHLIASKVQQPVAGTSGLGSPIKMKKPSKRFASEKIIHL